MGSNGFGLVVLEDRLDGDLLTDQGTGTHDSDYDQTGGSPGHPTTVAGGPIGDWRPYAIAAQDRAMDVQAIRAGFHGRDGAGLAYRLVADTTEYDWVGWEEPTLITNVSAPDASAFGNTPRETFAMCSDLKRQEVLLTYSDEGTGAQDGWTYRYHPDLEDYNASITDWAAANDGLASPVAMAYDAERDKIMLWHGPGTGGTVYAARWAAYESNAAEDDYTLRSVSWAPLGMTAPSAGARLYVETHVGRDWLMIYDHAGPGTRQLASSDRGATWRDVIGADLTDGTEHTTCAILGGGYLVAYINASALPCARILPTASSPFDDATEIEIDSTQTVEQIQVCTDADGIIYVIANDDTASSGELLYLWRSIDDGTTWDAYNDRIMAGDSGGSADDVQSLYGLVAAGGQLHLLTSMHTGLAVVIHLGGWSNVEHGSSQLIEKRERRFGFGGGASGASRDEPMTFVFNQFLAGDFSDWGWTLTGSFTSETPTYRGHEHKVTSTGPAYVTSIAGAGVFRTESAAQAIVYVEDMPAWTGSFVTSGGIQVRAVDNGGAPTTGWYIGVHLYSDRIVVRDGNGAATIGEAEVTVEGEVVALRVHVENGKGSAWYRFLGSRTWISLCRDETLTANAAIANGTMDAGFFTSMTGSLHWRMVGITDGRWHEGIHQAAEVFDLGSDGILGLRWGKQIPAVNGYPCPGLTTPSAKSTVGLLAGRGIAGASQTVRLPVRYQYALEHAFPSTSPSPRKQWRSGNTDLVEIEFDWGSSAQRWIGDVLALVVMNATPREWVLEHYSGSSWVEIGTLDLAIGTGLSWERDGRWVTPASGTTAITRYIHDGELVRNGAWFRFGSGESARIIGNSAGYWSDDSDLQQVQIEVDSTGGSGSSGSVGQLINGSGVMVAAVPSAPLAARYWRVRVDASQDTPDDEYRAGVIGIGRVVKVGADPGWGWRGQHELTRDVERRTDQFLEVRAAGPARRSLTYDWPDGVILRELHAGAAAGVGYASNPSIGTSEDAHSILTALLISKLDQGRVPCVVIPQLPDLDDTITDPRGFLYGRVRTDSHGETGMYGTEGDDEVVRVDGITFEELR